MPELVLAGTLVVVSQQEVVLKREKEALFTDYREVCHGKLTSKLAKQYQQKTCLHRLHIICAQPSSFSMGTAHIGQHLMRSLSKGMPRASVWPSAASRRVFSSQDIVGCHWKKKKKRKRINLPTVPRTVCHLRPSCSRSRSPPGRLGSARHRAMGGPTRTPAAALFYRKTRCCWSVGGGSAGSGRPDRSFRSPPAGTRCGTCPVLLL